jgi:hypothetical protein
MFLSILCQYQKLEISFELYHFSPDVVIRLECAEADRRVQLLLLLHVQVTETSLEMIINDELITV